MKSKLWGIVLIILGIIFGLNALNLTNIDIFFDGWWTFFIIIPSFINMFNNKERTGSFIGLIIGILLLLSCQDFLSMEIVLKLIFPIILIGLGLKFFFKETFKRVNIPDKINEKEYCATFSGQTLNFADEKFDGCNLTAVFGGIKCDLRNAIIKNDTVINISSIFGGVNLKVPKDYKLVIKENCLFGGVERKYKENKEAKKVIYLNISCLFGGVEIDD